MTQQFQVLKCYKCTTFQVHPVKKSFKWSCKMCGDKQSIKRNYGTGTGKECRMHVQKLNTLKCEAEESIVQQQCSSLEMPENSSTVNFINSNENEIIFNKATSSKWKKYIENENEEVTSESSNFTDTLNGAEVVLEIPNKKSRKTLVKQSLKKHHDTEESCANTKPPLTQSFQLFSSPNNVSIPSTDFSENISTQKPELPYLKNLTENTSKSYISKPKEYKPVCVSKSSKWAQFVDDEEDSEPEDINYLSTDPEDCTFEQDLSEDLPSSEKYNAEKIKLINSGTNSIDGVSKFDQDESVSVKREGLLENRISFSQCSDEDIDDLLNV